MPANTERLDYGQAGQNLYAMVVSRTSGNFWNGAAMTPYLDASYGTFAISMSEIGASGIYRFTMPAGVPANDDYDFFARVRSGGSPATGDGPAGSFAHHWDGTNLTPRAPAGGTLSAFQVGGLRFLRNRWTIITDNDGERLRVYAEDGITGDFSGIVTRDLNLAINSFTPDVSFVP